MNKKRLQSFLSMSVIIGFTINFILTLILGSQNKEIYNYLITGICSIIPLIVFSIILNIELYKYNKIDIKESIIYLFIFLLISFALGFLIEMLVINKLLNKDINNIIRLVNALYQSVIGVIIGINFSYDYYAKIIE